MRKRQERDDELRFLALLAQHAGADTADYEPPSVRIREDMAEAAVKAAADPERRRMEVLAAVEAVGGDLI